MVKYETNGSLTTATKTADGTAVEITTDATVPTDTSISLTVKQDESGGTTADSTETIAVGDGTTTASLSSFANATGSSWWLTIELSTSDDSVTPTFNSATLTVAQSVTVSPAPVELSFSVRDAFISPDTLIEPEPVTLDFTLPDAFIAPTVPPLQPESIELSLDVSDKSFIGPFILNDAWRVGGITAKPSGEIEMTPETTGLRFNVPRSEIDRWRQFDRAGDLSVSDGFGGAFRADASDGDGAVEVRPSFGELRPFAPSVDYLVSGYDEEQVAPDRFEISLDLQRPDNRDQGFPELAQTGDYELTLGESGTVGLDERQVGQLDASGSTTGREVTLPLLVSGEQAAALLDSLGYPAGVVERTVPDGDNRVVDESGRQAIDIATPDGALIESGEWLCRDWTLAWYSHNESARWRVELVLVQPD